MRVRTVTMIVLFLLFLIVVVQNTDVVPVRVLFWDLTMSRIILLALTSAFGVIVGVLLGRPWRRPQKFARIRRSTDTE